MSNAVATSETENVASQRGVEFDDLQLPVGARLQLLFGGNSQPRVTRLIGYARGEYLIVRIPVVGGLSIPVQEGEPLTVRVFSGVSAFAFRTWVTRALRGDIFLLFLAYPEKISVTTLRSAQRTRVDIPATVKPSTGEAIAATLVDLSVKGAMMKSETPLGGKDDELGISFGFRLQGDGDEYTLDLRAKIRNTSERGESGHYLSGVQFTPPQGNAMLYLRTLVYERLLEERRASV